MHTPNADLGTHAHLRSNARIPCDPVWQEAREVLGLSDPWEVEESSDYDECGELTAESVNQLQYLHAFVTEVEEQTLAQMHCSEHTRPF